MTRARAFRTAEPYWPPRGTGRLAAEIVAMEAGELKWIRRIGNRFTHERFRALAHQARVWAVDEHDRSSRAGKEVLDLGDFQRDHEISRSPASCGGRRSKKRSALCKSDGLGRLREVSRQTIVRSVPTSQPSNTKQRPT